MNYSNSRHRILLSTVEEMSQKSGMVRIEDFYDCLKEEHNIDRVTAGKLIIQLYREGELYSPQLHYIKRR